jgi:hypothetical protein
MSSTFEILSQHLSLGQVRSIIVTEIIPTDGGFTRAVRFFGEPIVNSTPRLLLDVTLTAADRASLEVSTPILQF